MTVLGQHHTAAFVLPSYLKLIGSDRQDEVWTRVRIIYKHIMI